MNKRKRVRETNEEWVKERGSGNWRKKDDVEFGKIERDEQNGSRRERERDLEKTWKIRE